MKNVEGFDRIQNCGTNVYVYTKKIGDLYPLFYYNLICYKLIIPLYTLWSNNKLKFDILQSRCWFNK